MKKAYVLYNPYSGNGKGVRDAKKLDSIVIDKELIYKDLTKIDSLAELFSNLFKEDEVILCGGDGTLNRFINSIKNIEVKNDIFYFATGSGNDFLNDLGKKKGEAPFCINKYLKNLPTIFVNGKEEYFINGIGYGVDGYCCEEGDKIRAKSDKKINYTTIALKGLLFDYHPTNAVVTVDGKKYTYKKVWLAPTMNGRFFGGGMMAAPMQDRMNKEQAVTLVVAHNLSKLKIVRLFPTIFKGNHIKYKDVVDVHSGHDITVEFDRPTALQIDGETVVNVLKYQVKSHAVYKVKSKDSALFSLQ